MSKMDTLKIDKAKLRTVENYAKHIGVSKPTVYTRIREGLIKKIVIDGVTFIHI